MFYFNVFTNILKHLIIILTVVFFLYTTFKVNIFQVYLIAISLQMCIYQYI